MSIKNCTTHFHACDCREAEHSQLLAFAREVMECWPIGDLDGGELQEIAKKHGLLQPEMRYAPCREDGCICAEYLDDDEFTNGVTCYRKSGWLDESPKSSRKQ